MCFCCGQYFANDKNERGEEMSSTMGNGQHENLYVSLPMRPFASKIRLSYCRIHLLLTILSKCCAFDCGNKKAHRELGRKRERGKKMWYWRGQWLDTRKSGTNKCLRFSDEERLEIIASVYISTCRTVFKWASSQVPSGKCLRQLCCSKRYPISEVCRM